MLLAVGVSYALPWWVVRWDMRRLRPERLERCWNSASLGAAVLGFGPLCLPFHFVKAHGLWRGLVLGLASLCLCGLAVSLVQKAVLLLAG